MTIKSLTGELLSDVAPSPHVNLSGANLCGAYLHGAILRGANLRGAYLHGAILRGANLRGADLYGANLREADLSRADLRRADLSRADFRGADLYGADLIGADLREARLDWQSHDLMAEILRQAAADNVSRRMLVGLILVSRDWCWKDFLRLEHPEKQWAIDTLAQWDGCPAENLRIRAESCNNPLDNAE